MSLNIKNERVHALVREAALRTGKSQTSVIEEALTHMLDGLNQEANDVRAVRLARAEMILADVDRRLTPAQRAQLNTDDLYDDAGLPR